MKTTIATKFKETDIGLIPEEWDVSTLGEGVQIIDGDRGTNYPNGDDFSTGGYCLFLNTKNVPNDRFNFSSLQFIKKSKDESMGKGRLERDDFVLTTRGTIGNIAFYGADVSFENIRINSGMVILRNDVHHDSFDNKFLYQLLKSKQIKNQLAELTTGSAQPQLPIRDLRNLKLICPPTDEQEEIAEILSSLDDKIELNHKINANLEKLASSLFKKWFVDIGDKLPGGWKISTIGKELNTFLGGTPSREKDEYWINGTIPWINSGKVNEFRITKASEYITQDALDNSAAKLLPKGTVVIAITGATLGQYSLLEIDSSFNQSVVGIREDQNLKKEFIYFWIATTINDLINAQTGGAQQHINKQVVDAHKILVPDQVALNRYYEISMPIFEMISKNCFEVENLLIIRDSLLPRLMSGKIKTKSI